MDGPVGTALRLIASGEPGFVGIVRLSLVVSLTAVAIGCLIGLPLGAGLALARFPGRAAVVVVFNALMGLPPVVAGLGLYLMLSRSGPLGGLGLLFTPPAMVLAQAVLILPIVVSLTRSVVEDLWDEYEEQLRSLGSSRLRAVPTLLWDGRFSLLTGVMAGFGRASAEVGAVLIVGGNIAGHTRTMTTAITLETSRGDLGLAVALGLVLLAITLAINAGAYGIGPLGAAGDGMRAEASILPLRLEGLGFAAGGRQLLDGIDLTVRAGRRLVVLGPNGAGKSLLLRICHGLIAPSRGAGRLDAAGVGGAGAGDGVPAAGAAAPVGPRQPRARAWRLRSFREVLRRSRAEAALARFGLEALAGQPARRLSGGEQQRLAMARAWALRPQVLFLDEPTAQLDPAATASIEAAIRRMADEGVTAVMTTHDLGQARRLAEDVAFLHRGRLVEAGPAEAFFAGRGVGRGAGYFWRGSCRGEGSDDAGLRVAGRAGPGAWTRAPGRRRTSSPSPRPPRRRIPASSATSCRFSKRRAGSKFGSLRRAPGRRWRPAKRGDADVVFVHAKAAEEAFVAEGWGVQRFEVMYNDFVLVGPPADPAGVKGKASAAEAMVAIAAAEAPFASRGDDSGTHQAEKALWAAAGVMPSGDWYRETGSGMGATLNIAAEMQAYSLTDRGTWISFKNRGGLEVLFEGDPALFNQYGVILVNPEKHPTVKTEQGQAFIDWLISEEGQAAIASFKIDGQQLFFPNAKPR